MNIWGNDDELSLKELIIDLNNDLIENTNSITKDFSIICEEIKNHLYNTEIIAEELQRQKRAIIGHQEEVKYYINIIERYLKDKNYVNCSYPKYYKNLSSAIYHELWGLAGIAEWYEGRTCELKNSYSAHIIGENIFFLIDGKMKKMPQKISRERKAQLKRALLSNDYRVRLDNDVPDIEMITGERIKIFAENVTRKGEETIIFRKFPITDYSFEKQIKLHSYPEESLEFFKCFAKLGYNIVFTGGVGTSKTTQLATWLSYEDASLCGLIIETRPELPIKNILPDSPIISLVVNSEEKLKRIRPSIMRSDADYVVMAEARDAYAYDIALKSANIGSRRCKMTAHINSPVDFPHEFASEISRVFGGDIDDLAIRIAKSYEINIHFITLSQDKNKKRLEGIYLFNYEEENHKIEIYKLCSYVYSSDSWVFNNKITHNMMKMGKYQNQQIFSQFMVELENLSIKFPMGDEESKIIIPFYSR